MKYFEKKRQGRPGDGAAFQFIKVFNQYKGVLS
jgi:hypothetical protein